MTLVSHNIHPNNSPLIPAEKVNSQTNTPGLTRFFSSKRETSLRSGSCSSSSSRLIKGSLAVSAIFSSAIDLEAVVKVGLWPYAPWTRYVVEVQLNPGVGSMSSAAQASWHSLTGAGGSAVPLPSLFL